MNDTKGDLVKSTLSKIAISGITAPAMPSDYETLLNRPGGHDVRARGGS